MFQTVKKNIWFLIGLFVFSLLVRSVIFIGYLSKNQNYWQVDSNTYHLIAQQIAKGNGICSADGQPNFYRLPGYPVFLSIYYKLFGVDPQNALWLQILLAALIPLLIFLLGCILFQKNILIAKMAGIYSSIHLGFVLYSDFFMSETLFIFLFLIFAILFLSSVHLFFCPQTTCACNANNFSRYICLPEPIATSEPYILLFEDMFENEQQQILDCCCQNTDEIKTSRSLLWAGLVLGLATLVRPVGHYLIALAVLILIFSNKEFKTKLSEWVSLLLGWLIPVSLWLIRNFMLTGHIFFHTLPGGHFLYFSASRIAMHEYNCNYDQAKNILNKKVNDLIAEKEQTTQHKLSEIEQCYVREDLAKQYFKKYPGLAIKLWATDIFRTAFSLYSAELLYLESVRKSFDYFNKDRTVKSMLGKHLCPQTNKLWLKWLIRFEIFMFLFILIGLLAGFIRIIIRCMRNWHERTNKIQLCSWINSLAFISLFIVIGLAGGYARMRLPAEPFLIILSMSFWTSLFRSE